MAVADPSSVFVQSTAASALGFLGRRAAAERSLVPTRAIVEALMPALSMELCAARGFTPRLMRLLLFALHNLMIVIPKHADSLYSRI